MSTVVQAPERLVPRTLPASAARDRERFDRVRARVAEQIHSLESLLASAAGTPVGAPAGTRQQLARAERKLRLLKQLQRELPLLQPQELAEDRAGLGSMLTLEDTVTGEFLEYLLMSGEDIDIAAGQVSLGSPIGQAVLGLGLDAQLRVVLPRGTRSFRIVALTTLPAMLGLVPHPGAPAAPGRSGRKARGRQAAPRPSLQ